MIERLQHLPPGIDGLRASGTVTEQDYETVVAPLLEEAARASRRVRLLYQVGPDFQGFTVAGAWADARLGLQHLDVLERVALVSDVRWMRALTQLISAALPCPVAAFSNAQWTEALGWLAPSAAGTTVSHRLLEDTGVLVVEPSGVLRREDFEAISRTIDPWIRTHGELRGVVVHARAFPGWENLGSLLRHVRFVREHHRNVRRVALAADGWAAELVPMLARHVVDVEMRQFPYAEFDEAVRWAGAATTASAAR